MLLQIRYHVSICGHNVTTMSQDRDTSSINRDIVDKRARIGIQNIEAHLRSLDRRKTHDTLIAYGGSAAHLLPLSGTCQPALDTELLYPLTQRYILLNHHGADLSVPAEIHCKGGRGHAVIGGPVGRVTAVDRIGSRITW